MHILLLNTNPVVSRLMALCLRDDEHLLEEVSEVHSVKHQEYDIVFVDDLSYVNEAKRVFEKLITKNKVYLSSGETADAMAEYFDEVIKKPFLPSQIIAVIERIDQKQEAADYTAEDVPDTPFIFPLSSEKQEEKTEEEYIDPESEEKAAKEELEELFEPAKAAEVLDSREIEKIKALLDEDEEVEIELADADYEARKVEVITEHLEADGLEIISEDEIVDLLSSKEKEKKKKSHKEKKKKKQKSKKKKPEEETYSFEEALIAAIEGMKIKKIKKLLKDKDVHIRITGKDKK